MGKQVCYACDLCFLNEELALLRKVAEVLGDMHDMSRYAERLKACASAHRSILSHRLWENPHIDRGHQ